MRVLDRIERTVDGADMRFLMSVARQAEKVRNLQREYFHARKDGNAWDELRESKAAEKALDAMLAMEDPEQETLL